MYFIIIVTAHLLYNVAYLSRREDTSKGGVCRAQRFYRFYSSHRPHVTLEELVSLVNKIAHTEGQKPNSIQKCQFSSPPGRLRLPQENPTP
jgi:hypothetical protein